MSQLRSNLVSMLLLCFVALMVLTCQASEKKFVDDRDMLRDLPSPRIVIRHSRSALRNQPFELNLSAQEEVPFVQSKRERPHMMGYGWQECEFSPMSCLLRRRRAL
ncbi:hypothetical protein M3Y95_01177800 [Aphelenchoides besseyi]|nr:hypothetical protein M3Y95_01177800 [Aphelenchoides besseyi]